MIGETTADIVAGRAGDGSVLRQPGVEVQLTTQGDAVGRRLAARRQVDFRPGLWVYARGAPAALVTS